LISKEGIEVYGPITGDDEVKVRILKAQQFAETTEPAVYVATLASASESINELVAAQELIINDLYWNPLLLIQAEGRLHRSGQQGSVHVLYVTAKGTIDELLLETLYNKAQAVETLGISDEAKKMVGNIGGMAPQDDMNSFVNSVSAQIKAEGYGLDDEELDDD
jgi:SWI/SNF-related matrix-associated actin-dependent regulator of chromatin subfamily A-like protein 1